MQNLIFWNRNLWLRTDRYLEMFILINWIYLSTPGKMYAYMEKLSQTILHINLVSAVSDPVCNPRKGI